MNNYKLFSVFIIVVMVTMVLGAPINVLAQNHTPIAVAFIARNQVSGFHWPEGALVTLTIDDPTNGSGIDYTDTKTVVVTPWDSVDFPLSGFTLQPGHLITLTDGVTTKEHTVTSLTFGGGDVYADTVWGTADAGAVIDIVHQTEQNIFRSVTTNQNGDWLADFSIPGDESGEENPYNIQIGDVLMIIEDDEDGDHTQVDWQVSINTNVIQFSGNGHSYQAIDIALPWHEAQDYCSALDGHLVTIDSVEENQFVFELLPWSWLGATDEVSEGTWLWVTGEPWDYENWAPGEPTNCCPPEYCGGDSCTPEHYLTFWGDPYIGEWNDVPDGVSYFVCEWDTIHIKIDIKPGSDPNSINLESKGGVPVAVLTTDEFDAGNLDPATVVFAGALPLRWAQEDVDWDGDMDLLFHFKTQELNLDNSSTEAILLGNTFDGTAVEGKDLVKIVPKLLE